MYCRLHALMFVMLVAPVLAVGQEPSPRFDAFKAPSLTALTEPKSRSGFSIPPVAEWSWYDGEPGCELGPIGLRVDKAVRDLMRTPRKDDRLPSPALLTTTRNAVGPMLMDSEAIFKAAARLIETADREIDLISFKMEPDAPPYVELARALDRRLRSPRPIARPFRIRIYADNLTGALIAGTARSTAQSLLEPWLELFRAHWLDPKDVRLEVYVHGHGGVFYHQGARYSVHDKFLVVDGTYLHIGGANPQHKNNYVHPERDTAIVMKGDVARSALSAFDALWSRADFSCGVELARGAYRPRCTDRSVPFAVEHDPAVSTPDLAAAGVSARACVPAILLSKGKKGFQNIAGGANPWARGMLAAVSAAEQRIDLASPNLNAPPLLGAIVDAATARNVRLQMLLPFERNESQVNGLGGHGSNERALQVLQSCAIVARARSHDDFQRFSSNVQAAWWVAEGERDRFTGDGPGCFHTKFAAFDNRVVIVGSGNLDDQSFYHSTETSVLIDDAAVTRAVSAFMFEPEWRRAVPFSVAFLRPAIGPAPPDYRAPGLDTLLSDAKGMCSGLGSSGR